MRYSRLIARSCSMLLVAAGLVLAEAPLASNTAVAEVSGGTIDSTGPLSHIATSPDLNCAVNHVADEDPEFFGTTACGTLVATDGVLYGPADIPAGGAASPRTPWTPVSQTSSGTGTSINPYRVVTVVTGGPLRLTQTDSYVVGDEAYATRISVENTSATERSITLYRAADCYLQNSDFGYGRSDAAAGSVACVTGPEADARIEQWAPLTSGSHFFESGYSTVWARIGAQQPFPDTSADGTLQDNGAGLSWSVSVSGHATAAFSHLTAFSPQGTTEVSDSDGDGFPDSWEEPDGGVDTNGDGVPDLKLSDYGATPNKPDVFVQVNWTQTRHCAIFTFFCSTTNRRPSLAALNDVQKAYQRNGIRLHVDAGPDSVMNPDTGAKWGARSEVHNGIEEPAMFPGQTSDGGFDWSHYDTVRNQLVSAARARIFHTALYVGSFNSDGNSGLSRSTGDGYAGRDLMVATDVSVFGSSGDTGSDGVPGMSRLEEAGTFMHELGHNLGLSHGGAASEAIPWKPNYPSVMNYYWQLRGTYKSSTLGLLDYSHGTLDSVDENHMNEVDGLEPDSAAGDIATAWACPDRSNRGPSPSVRNVDWNCDGRYDTDVRANVTGTRGETDYTELNDYDDWAHLVFDGGGALGGAGIPASVPTTTPASLEQATAAQIVAAAPDLQSVTISSPQQVMMQTGTDAMVTVKVKNRTSAAGTFTLSSITQGVTLTNLPAQVALGAGEERSMVVTVRAAAVSDDSYFEIDATQTGNDANSAAAVTGVYVVSDPVPGQPGAVSAASVLAGTVVDNSGFPVPGATVSLQRSPNNVAAYIDVPESYGPSDATGGFSRTVGDGYYDVNDGYYKIKVVAAGCTDTASPGLQAPPARTGLTVKVACTASHDSLSAPTIAGSPQVGQTLVGSVADAPSGFSRALQWLRDGTPVGGATASTYTVGDQDQGHVIALRATYQRAPGKFDPAGTATLTFDPVLKTSAPTGTVTGVPLPPVTVIRNVDLPEVSGTAVVGRVLSAWPGYWTPSDVTLSYTWLRNGAPIVGATGSSYRLAVGDIGRRIAVQVVAHRAGSDPVRAVSTATAAVKQVSALGLASKVVKKKVTIRIKLTAAGVRASSLNGRAVISLGSRTLRTVTVANGTATVVLTKQAKGTHAYRVSYLGNGTVLGKVGVVKAKVKR